MKTKILIGFTMMMAALCISAAPALAQFEGKNTGKGEAPEPGTFEGGGGSVKCASAKTELVKLNKEKEGTEVNLGTLTWNKCLTKAVFFEAEAKIKCNELIIVQTVKEGKETAKALGKQAADCTVEVPLVSCVILVPAAENKELGKITLKKESTNIINGVVEVTGITQKVNKNCENNGVKNTKEAKLKVPKIKATAEKLQLI
jgi:hypothetical protein